MIRPLVFKACELLLSLNPEVISPNPFIEQGLTSYIRFSPLEIEVESKLSAATADDAEVDQKYWAVLGENMEESRAREVLRRFVALWWRYF